MIRWKAFVHGLFCENLYGSVDLARKGGLGGSNPGFTFIGAMDD